MTSTTTVAPARPENPAPTAAVRQPSLYSRYTGAMLYFMGAALIAGAVVHYPIDPALYSAICAVGAGVFLLGTIVNEFVLATVRPAPGRAVSLVVFSLLLSFGVGLVGGGIQHFTQFPERSAAMTPIGVVLSYLAFVAKDPEGRPRHVLGVFGAAVLLTAALTWLGMSALADTIGSDGHDHDHGTGQTPGEATTPSPTPSPIQVPTPPSDGHTGHPH